MHMCVDAVRAVPGIFRSEESAKRVRERLGNPSEDKFVTVIGTFGEWINYYKYYVADGRSISRPRNVYSEKNYHCLIPLLICTDSETNTVALYKRVLERVGEYTDVVATVGAFIVTKLLLEETVEKLRDVSACDIVSNT